MMTLMDIVGHVEARERLGRIASLSVGPQSYLFSGPRRLGKFLVALEFAQKLTGVVEGSALDIDSDILVFSRRGLTATDPLPKSNTLSVADVRQAEEFLSRFPRHGKYRVVIIDEAERLTTSAENALLKILEEPNSTSIIILVTHLSGKLLPTVRSRLFMVPFRPLAPEELQTAFPNSDLPDFFFSLGLPGLIAEAIRDKDAFGEKKDLLRGLFQLSRLNWTERLALAERLARDPEVLPDTLEIWITGLERQQGSQAMRSIAFVSFLDAALKTLDRISAREGSPRLLLEGLFTQV